MPIMLNPGACCCRVLPEPQCLHAGDIDDMVWNRILTTDIRVDDRNLPGLSIRNSTKVFDQNAAIGQYGNGEIIPASDDLYIYVDPRPNDTSMHQRIRYITSIDQELIQREINKAFGTRWKAWTEAIPSSVYIVIFGVTESYEAAFYVIPIDRETGTAERYLSWILQNNIIMAAVMLCTVHPNGMAINLDFPEVCSFNYCSCHQYNDINASPLSHSTRTKTAIVPWPTELTDISQVSQNEPFTLYLFGDTEHNIHSASIGNVSLANGNGNANYYGVYKCGYYTQESTETLFDEPLVSHTIEYTLGMKSAPVLEKNPNANEWTISFWLREDSVSNTIHNITRADFPANHGTCVLNDNSMNTRVLSGYLPVYANTSNTSLAHTLTYPGTIIDSDEYVRYEKQTGMGGNTHFIYTFWNEVTANNNLQNIVNLYNWIVSHYPATVTYGVPGYSQTCISFDLPNATLPPCEEEISPVFSSSLLQKCKHATSTTKPWGKSCFECKVTECRSPKRPPVTDLVAAHLRFPVNADGSENRESGYYEVRSKYCNQKSCSCYEEE